MIDARLSSDMSQLLDEIIIEMRERLKIQGHVNTGRLSNSLRERVRIKGLSIIGEISGLDYWQKVDEGTPADKVVVNNQYIRGLIRYFRQKRVLDPVRAAWATSVVHRREGIPTRASRRFSDNGKRTGAFTDVINEMDKKIENFVEGITNELILRELENLN